MTHRSHEPFAPQVKAPKRRRIELTGWAVAGMIFGTALIVSTFTWAITLATSGPHAYSLGTWLADFAKSSGLAGVLAVFAAMVALFGLNQQLTHQKRADADRAWWERFQWASSRALPLDPSHHRFAYASIIDVLTALANSATDEVQEGAVGAVMEVASLSVPNPANVGASQPVVSGGPSDGTPTANPHMRRDGDGPASGHSTEYWTEVTELALSRYVGRTAGTAAESGAARERLYEMAFYRALEQLPRDFSFIHPAPGDADFAVERNGRVVVIELKDQLRLSSEFLTPSIESQLRFFRGVSGVNAVLMVTSTDVQLWDTASADGINAITWRGSAEDTARLIRTLRNLTPPNDQ